MDQLKKLFQSLSPRQRLAILAAVVVCAGAIWTLTDWRRAGDFKPLYTSMAPEDAGAVVQKLKESGVAYRLGDGGGTVLVPSAKVAEARLELAAAGLPKSGRMGFELFDKTNFGATEFVEHINYQRALEGELERSMMALAEVEQARVHLTFAKESVFLESAQPAKASVMLRLRPGARLQPQNVLAISHLVASAVEGLAPEAVAVLDMHGNLLSSQRKAASEPGQPSAEFLELERRMERDLVSKINATLAPLLGAERFRVAAAVECDWNSAEQSEETYDPAREAVLSSQKSEENAAGGNSAGVPGTASNLPRPTSRPLASASGLTRRTENVTYQPSRLVKKTRLAQGNIKRLSVSVLVDQEMHWEGQGRSARRVLAPPAPETLKVIRDVVAGATGLNPARGDQLIVESLPFESTLHADRPETPVPPSPAPWWNRNPRILILSGMAGAALLALLGGGAFLLRRRHPPRHGVETRGALAAGEATTVEQLTDSSTASRRTETLAGPKSRQQLGAAISGSAVVPRVQTSRAEALKQNLIETIHKEPELAAKSLRTWLEE